MRVGWLIRTAVAIGIFGIASVGPVATAGPITARFSGSISHYSDFPNSTPITDRIGASISGYLIYNIDNAETARVEQAPNGGGFNGIASNAGCESVFNGICQNDWGTDKPVLTEYRIITPWGSITSLSGDYATQSEFGFTRGPDAQDPRDLYERVDGTRDDRRYEIFADGTTSFVARQFGFALFNYFSHGVLFGDLWDLTQVPDAQPGPNRPSQIESRLQLWNVAQTCQDAFGTGCRNDGDNFWMIANLGDVEFRRGVHRIPEPGTLALLSVGILVLILARRRMR